MLIDGRTIRTDSNLLHDGTSLTSLFQSRVKGRSTLDGAFASDLLQPQWMQGRVIEVRSVGIWSTPLRQRTFRSTSLYTIKISSRFVKARMESWISCLRYHRTYPHQSNRSLILIPFRLSFPRSRNFLTNLVCATRLTPRRFKTRSRPG